MDAGEWAVPTMPVGAAAGTTEGAHSSGMDDEPRYTAAEWAELQRSQEVDRSRS